MLARRLSARRKAAGLTQAELGALITLDQIYEIQGSALDVDTQNTMARIFEHCAEHNDLLGIRCAKAVALLQMLQGDEESTGVNTTSKLVAQCLYANINHGDNEPAGRFGLTYLLANTTTAERVTVRAYVDDEDKPAVASVVPLWEGANWLEREVFDMFGIQFEGHSDLRRILMPEEFSAYPLRKDYPLQGRG